MKLVLFGGGKIGRSFIGQVFSRSGYEVVFVDINQNAINALNTLRGYDVVVKEDTEQTIRIENVRGVMAIEKDKAAQEVATADILAVSVGKNALRSVLPIVAEGLMIRYRSNPKNALDIIIAENMRDADVYCKEILMQNLPNDYPIYSLVGLVETSIGKMVPIMPDMGDDILTVYAEKYNSLIVAGNSFKNPIPQVVDLEPKKNIKAWVDRKLFIHNMGHTTTAYLGNLLMPETTLLCDILKNEAIEAQVRATMQQSAQILLNLYPDEFTAQELNYHINDLIARFKNPHLGDTVYRVGSDLTRKLRRDDRMLIPIITAFKKGIPYDKILDAFVAGTRFNAVDSSGAHHPNDKLFKEAIDVKGIRQTLTEVCMLDSDLEIDLIRAIENKLRCGVISMGTWLVDIVKFIDNYPAQGNLTTITNIEVGAGGCSHNVLIDLAKLNVGLPLYAGGCIGNDANGDLIMNEIVKHGIDSRHMTVLEDTPTSYTDVMTESDGGGRTFFHYRGSNATLGLEHFENIETPAKIFHLGYLLLLDKLDDIDSEYGHVASRILCNLQKMGYKTSVDVVSEQGNRFRDVVASSLPYIDYLIVNEVESGACCNMNLRDDKGEIDLNRVAKAAQILLDMGVNEVVVIHFPEGGYACRHTTESCYVPTIKLSKSEVLSSVGAGDAFCAGMIYALHEQMSLKDALILANTAARFNLFSPTCTGGAPTMETILKFIDDHKDFYLSLN